MTDPDADPSETDADAGATDEGPPARAGDTGELDESDPELPTPQISEPDT